MALNTFGKTPEQEIRVYMKVAAEEITKKHYNLAFGSIYLVIITAKRYKLQVPDDAKKLLSEISAKEPSLKEKTEQLIKSIRI